MPLMHITDYLADAQGLTHKDQILRALKMAGKRGLTTDELIKINASNYRARICDLRADGWNIAEGKRQRKGSWVYRLHRPYKLFKEEI